MHKSFQTIINRRAVVAGIAAAPALAVPVAAATSDPLPVMVAEWERLHAARETAADKLDAAIEAHGAGEEVERAEAAFNASYDALEAVGAKICATPATTTAGVVALLRYFVADFGEDFAERYGCGFERIVDTFAITAATLEG